MTEAKLFLIDKLKCDFDRFDMKYVQQDDVDIYLLDLNLGINITKYNIQGVYCKNSKYILFVPESYFYDADSYNKFISKLCCY